MSRVSRGVHMAIQRRMMHADVQAVSATFTTFVSDTAEPVIGETGAALTFTAKDASDQAIEGVSVTYA